MSNTRYPESRRQALRTYTKGFAISLLLTLTAYVLVVNRIFNGWALVFAIVVLAVIQLCVQLLFFLHVGEESKPRWKVLVLLFAGLVVAIVVFGSLWIMNNLHYNMMTPAETDKQMIEDEGIQR